ncbi:hypothetical protein LQ948_13620 [Jiella sp. MQZ9-1]|uniref:DUF2474 domain-containing protein n=1 Tax=Jiella flava TaxID=2816857 RepID=A0A939JT71_9HYPH|nr:hypothetical protein [Jiella flava]MBO0663678.1 hypothetical protein [Jiella flava]MCD2472251.1 hypothetical protein [Jiella flava]
MPPEDVRDRTAERPPWERILWLVILCLTGIGIFGAVVIALRLILIG